MPEVPLGRVVHYYSHLHMADLEITDELKIGERIRIVGQATETEQPVLSLQVEHRNVEAARPGEHVAIMVCDPVHPGDRVFKVVS